MSAIISEPIIQSDSNISHNSHDLELYEKLAEGRADINAGRKYPFGEAMAILRQRTYERQNG